MNIEKTSIPGPQSYNPETQKKTESGPNETISRPVQDPKWALPSYSPFGNPGKKEDHYMPNFSSDAYVAPASTGSKETNTQEDWEKIHGKFDIKFA